jgi:hypothetical protein
LLDYFIFELVKRQTTLVSQNGTGPGAVTRRVPRQRQARRGGVETVKGAVVFISLGGGLPLRELQYSRDSETHCPTACGRPDARGRDS